MKVINRKIINKNFLSQFIVFFLIIVKLGLIPLNGSAGENGCKDLIEPFLIGAEFLKKKNPSMHLQPSIDRETKRLKKEIGGQEASKPVNKIASYLTRLKGIYDKYHDNNRFIYKLKGILYQNNVIKPGDVPEGYFELQKRIARERGHGNITITDEMRSQEISNITQDQKASLDNWIEYFMSFDTKHYPIWLKIWAYEGVTKLSKLEEGAKEFLKRSKGTVAPYPELNREALGKVMEAVEKNAKGEVLDPENFDEEFRSLLKDGHFGNLYARAIRDVTKKSVNMGEVSGEWIKYNRGESPERLVNSLKGKNTGWCTANMETARNQLSQGDFYVYYSKDELGRNTNPRIAIRMEGDEIGEVRGIAKNQNMDGEISKTDILEDKLKEFGKKGERYKKKDSDMKRLTEIDEKNKKGEMLSKEELRFLYEIDIMIEGFGYQKDPRIKEIIATRNIKKDVAYALNIMEHEVSLTREEALSGGIKYHYGDLDLSDLTSAEGLELPKTINGSLNLSRLTSAEGLKLPDSIGGDLYLNRLTSAEELKLPKSIGGGLNLESLTSAKGLELPKSINGSLSLNRLTSAEGLKLPKSIGGSLDLISLTSAEGLILPKSIGGNLNLRRLTSVEGLILPKSIGGNLNLNSLTSAEGLILPKSIGGSLYLRSLTSAEGLKFPDSIGGSLDLISLTSAEGLKIPESFIDNIFVNKAVMKMLSENDFVGFEKWSHQFVVPEYLLE